MGACAPGDTVARLGGDEFTLLLEDLSHAQEATGTAERIQQALKRPFELAGARDRHFGQHRYRVE